MKMNITILVKNMTSLKPGSWCVGLFLLVSMQPVLAAKFISVQALFNNMAVVSIDGKRTTLRVGKPGPDGVELISANSHVAIIEVDGKRKSFKLGSDVGGKYQSASSVTEQIIQNNVGMYTTVGSINGLPVSFLVDTGATLIALNSDSARRLGIDFRVNGKLGQVTTASGVNQAYYVKLDKVKVGKIQLRDVEAVVLDGPQPETALLGMSFLGRLAIKNEGKILTLQKKY
jgi:aspartyl protease family protein